MRSLVLSWAETENLGLAILKKQGTLYPIHTESKLVLGESAKRLIEAIETEQAVAILMLNLGIFGLALTQFTMKPTNIHDLLPTDLTAEIFEDIIRTPNIRIERIISNGHTSPATGCYDQAENEWVILLQGAAVLTFEDAATCHLSAGDYINIPAHRKHQVSWTDPTQLTIWLAVFYK
jgi:cupin 2 domain-containing protein